MEELTDARAVEIVDKGNQIIAAAKALAPDLSLSAVYNVLRPTIRRTSIPINATMVRVTDPKTRTASMQRVQPGYQLVTRDPLYARNLELAQDAGTQEALVEFWTDANRMADRLAEVEALFYEARPMAAARLLKIVSQSEPIRDTNTNTVSDAIGEQPLQEMTLAHVQDWDAARQAGAAA